MSKPKIYLDNCVYNRPFDDQRQMRVFLEAQAKMYIQRLITENRLALAYSYMSLYENKDNPLEERRTSINSFFQNASIYIDHDKAEQVETTALAVMGFNIHQKDAIHIACAIIAECDYFITTDDIILRRYHDTGIALCNPIDFIKILEERHV
jgi:hypothetical protein